MIMRYVDGLLLFQFRVWEITQMSEDTLFYKNIISKNIEAETEGIFSSYFRGCLYEVSWPG